MELSERDLDNMFGGLYLGKPAFYYLYWGSTWFPQRFDLEVSRTFCVELLL